MAAVAAVPATSCGGGGGGGGGVALCVFSLFCLGVHNSSVAVLSCVCVFPALTAVIICFFCFVVVVVAYEFAHENKQKTDDPGPGLHGEPAEGGAAASKRGVSLSLAHGVPAPGKAALINRSSDKVYRSLPCTP